MEVLYLLVPFALLLGGFFIAGFIWSVKSGHYDDLETPAHRILIDEQEEEIEND
ncbi:MAG: cbb3-type cytochrome oxidase assembly protein CcoS [Bdellovibrionales bacterium]|nr:cbb3-type cytochrome oxidase assembly protein CcoS [Bdellovibrionales bacterium]MBT3526518.1 cbb3-type cytochrome oxidase assembly protein CcoS [Bdellovibrionales bacterium]MBT7669860.1 cbb3-type cytochrome oxidase assembly protein CcoS [Bdellovibrionales bacterium]MBT7766722.1 cbb3-type cytochrome oxidase assembly protein CcoS [Bdellovibrionales bacterium]